MRIALDLDGTLITAKERQSLLLKAVALRYGINISPEDVWAIKREGKNNSFALGKLGVKKELVARIDLAWRYEIESPYWLDMDSLFCDTRSCLHEFAKTGCELYLVTARKNEYLLKHQLFKLDISKLFSGVICVNPSDAVNQKSQILKEVRPSYFIGDSETDFQSSALADVKFCGVTTGQRSEHFLRSLGITVICQSLTQALSKIVV